MVADHLARGFRDIGYARYYWLDRATGAVMVHEGREDDGDPFVERGEVGAHVAGANSWSLGVCISGTWDDEPPPESLIDAAARGIAVLCFERGLQSSDVYGHRECGDVTPPPGFPAVDPTDKSCPGRMVDMDAFRARVGRHLAGLHDLAALPGAV